MSEIAPQSTPTNKKRVYIILAAVVVTIALLATLCVALSPNPIWGPRILKSSPIDTSLIERLDGHTEFFGQEEMEAWIDAIEQGDGPLRELSGNLTHDESRWDNPGESGSFGGYSFRYSGAYYDGFFRGGGTAGIAIFSTIESSKERLEGEKERGPRADLRYEHVVISDDVEVLLGPVFWSRSSHPPFWYGNEKRLEAYVRVNNVRLRFHEVTDLDFAGVATNLALKQIVEALESLELEKD